jgi:hypothetical protein
MDELALLPQHIGVKQDMLDRAILTDKPGLVVWTRCPATPTSLQSVCGMRVSKNMPVSALVPPFCSARPDLPDASVVKMRALMVGSPVIGKNSDAIVKQPSSR